MTVRNKRTITKAIKKSKKALEDTKRTQCSKGNKDCPNCTILDCPEEKV
jgi:hypothetical protein